MMLVPWASQASCVSRENYFFTSQIVFLTLNFLKIWLVRHWVTLATQCWNRNQVYSSITLTLVMLRWCQQHNYCEQAYLLLSSCFLVHFLSLVILLYIFLHSSICLSPVSPRYLQYIRHNGGVYMYLIDRDNSVFSAPALCFHSHKKLLKN